MTALSGRSSAWARLARFKKGWRIRRVEPDAASAGLLRWRLPPLRARGPRRLESRLLRRRAARDDPPIEDRSGRPGDHHRGRARLGRLPGQGGAGLDRGRRNYHRPTPAMLYERKRFTAWFACDLYSRARLVRARDNQRRSTSRRSAFSAGEIPAMLAIRRASLACR